MFVLLAPILAPGAVAENVDAFTSAAIRLLPQNGIPGTNWVPMDIDPDNPPDDPTDFSIPAGSVAEIYVTGTATTTGGVAYHIMDDDLSEHFRGFDDELTTAWSLMVVQAGAMFGIKASITCAANYWEIEDLESSGEQSAEIFIKDGAKRIPADRNLPDGKKQRSWWKIVCDKWKSEPITQAGGSVITPWGDSLVVPAGALPADTDVRMSNMYPLANVEAVPPGFMPVSEAQRIEPDGLALLVPAQLTLGYKREEAGETADERTLQIFRYDAMLQRWLPHPGATVDLVHHTISVPIQEFGTYGFAAEIPTVPTLSPLGLGIAAVGLLILGYMAIRRRQQQLLSARPSAP